MLIFVDNLSATAAVFIRRYLKRRDAPYKTVKIFALKKSRFDFFSKLIIGRQVEEVIHFSFKYEDLCTENGKKNGLRTAIFDVNKIWSTIRLELSAVTPELNINTGKFYSVYLQKLLTLGSWCYGRSKEIFGLRNLIILINAIPYYCRENNLPGEIILILKSRPWPDEIKYYSKDKGLIILFHPYIVPELLRNIFNTHYRGARLRNLIRSVLFEILPDNIWERKNIESHESPENTIVIDQTDRELSVERVWSASNLATGSLIFVSRTHTIDKRTVDTMNVSGMTFMALSRAISSRMKVPFGGFGRINSDWWERSNDHRESSDERKFLTRFLVDYRWEVAAWTKYFSELHTKIYVTHHKWLPHPVAAADAIRELGGISALWQVSYYEFMSPYGAIATDIYFSFNRGIVNQELIHDSRINYVICTGYLNDYRFERAKKSAGQLRTELIRSGAERIVSFFDNSAWDDERWGVSIDCVRKEYEFWLTKVLENKWFGLVVKPKKGKTLEEDLGQLTPLLEEAIKTGRCYLPRSGKHITPAEVALGSDVSVCSPLWTGSAAMETALAGVPTLMLDRDDWEESEFYRLGVGRVVFEDLESLWGALKEHWWIRPVYGLGDWSELIEELDPFRDGKAAFRMSSYLDGIHKSLGQGADRITSMQEASEQYARRWGEDKVVNLISE